MGSEQSSVNPDPSGTINIEITAPRESCGSRLKATGYCTHAITDQERKLFKITSNELKAAVKDHFGKEPTDAFLTRPNLYGDMYASNDDFSPVLTTVTAVRAKIIKKPLSSDVTLATRRFINKSDEIKTFETTFTETENNTISSTWSADIKYGLDINYDIKLPIIPSISLCNSFGTNLSSSRTVTINSYVSATLDPGKSVVVHLKSKKYTVFVEVTYEVTLEGHVACNYEHGHKGHTFWALDINDVLEAAGKPTVRETSEILELNYYTDGENEMSNLNTDCSATDDFCLEHGVCDYYLGNR